MAVNVDSPDRELSPATLEDSTTVVTQLDTDESGSIRDDDDRFTTAAQELGGTVSRWSAKRTIVLFLVLIVALAALTGWWGWSAYQARQAEQRRELFLQVGRQEALNLTTIDFQEADKDVQRILESATDTFYDDFSKRAQPFVDVVKQARSTSLGEVTAAGLEAEDASGAKVLVAVTVKTSTAGTPEPAPRSWRIRMTVKMTDNSQVKVSNVEFVQ